MSAGNNGGNKPTRKPWEDNSGNILPDDVLKEVSKSWSDETWEAYLKTLEAAERETLVPAFERVLYARDAASSLREFQIGEMGGDARTKLVLSDITVRKAIYQLTHRQRTLIILVYVHDLPVPEAARQLGISPIGAGRTLRRALTRLKEILSPKVEKARE